TFSSDGASTGNETGLVVGDCYRWTLTVTDRAANTTGVIRSAAIYVANFDTSGAGEETYFSRVPFDLGGGLRLQIGVHNGEATLERDLFTIPSYGPPQALSLRYSSAETTSSGRFGIGWNSNLTQSLSFDSGLVVWHRADGGREGFTNGSGSWAVIGAHYETLAAGSGADAGRYIITLHDQTKLVFDGTAPGRLVRIENRFGKSLTFSWGSSSATATDASGRATTLAIDAANNRITSATDSAGRAWSFGYTGTDL